MNHLIALLLAIASYRADVACEIMPPNASEPITYQIELTEQKASGNPAIPWNYLIVSRRTDSDSSDENFSAYISGNFYRFRDDRLFEQNIADTPPSADIPRNEIFASLLPSFIAETLTEIENDSTYTVAVEDSENGYTVGGRQTVKGYIFKEFSYSFDSKGNPLYSEITSNPGEISEQTVTARYTYPVKASTDGLSEEMLAARFTDAFENLRAANFNIRVLEGRPLPSFSIPTAGKDRISHQRREPLERPLLIVFLDMPGKDTVSIMKHTRTAATTAADIVFTFNDTYNVSLTDEAGNLPKGESVAYSAASFARHCGVSAFPSFILADESGTVIKTWDDINNFESEFVKYIE